MSALLQFVYVSTGLGTEPHLMIGFFLKDADEVRSVDAVFDAIEQVFQTAGVDATCEIYIACSKWSKLVQAIDHPLQIMQDKRKFPELVGRSQTAANA